MTVVESKSESTQVAVSSSSSSCSSSELVVEVETSVVVKEQEEILEKTEKEKEEAAAAEEEEEEEENSSEERRSIASVLVDKSSSFREESNFLSDLRESEKKALLELRDKLEEAILENKLFKSEGEEEGGKENDMDIKLWGVPLLPIKCFESTNVVLLKFLRAREFKADDAFSMLQNTIKWRKENKIDTILDEDCLCEGLEGAAYMEGTDRQGHPVCYNVYGVFQDDKLYQKTFGSEEKVEKFLRCRIRLIEKEIQKMNFNPGRSNSSILQVIDLKNGPGVLRKELRVSMKKAVGMLQDNYPEFVVKSIFINVPFWYCAVNTLLSPFLTKRTKSKFVFARSSNVTETLLRYIPGENISINYGGLKHPNDEEFSMEDGTEVSNLIVINAGSTENIEIPVTTVGTTVVWDITALGWEVNYKEEFIPEDEGSYTIIIQKGRKMLPEDKQPVRNSFRNNEPGKIVLTIENTTTYKKKKVLFRYKKRQE